MDQGTLLKILFMLVLVALSGFFSATETAFSCLNRARLKNLADRGDRRAARTLALSERYDELLSTILVGNNIVNIALASIGTVVFVSWIGDAGVSVSTAVITVVVLVSILLCWLVAIVTAVSGIKYLWDNRSFINTAK